MVFTEKSSKQSFRKQIISLLQKLLEERKRKKGREEKFPQFEAIIKLGICSIRKKNHRPISLLNRF